METLVNCFNLESFCLVFHDMKRYLKALCEEMSSEDESDEISEKETVANHSEAPSSRQAKKVARLKQISYQNEHKEKYAKCNSLVFQFQMHTKCHVSGIVLSISRVLLLC